MGVINEVCGTTTTAPKNMGGKKQCLEKPAKTIILANDAFSFADTDAMKDAANWKTATAAKNTVPFPTIEGIELSNTEAIIKNGRYSDYTLKEGVSGVKYRFDISVCTYDGLKSYLNSSFNRVFEVTSAEEVTCDVQGDGTVKGRKMSSFLIGQRNQATDADVPFVDVTIKFEDDVHDIIRAGFSASELEGVFDLDLEVSGTPTTTEIKFTAFVECTGAVFPSLTQADMKFVQDSDGLEEAITGLSFADGVYTITAAAFETGKLSTDGVITQTDIIIESDTVQVTI